MKPRYWMGASLLLWLLMGGIGLATSSPASTVQVFIDAHRQGRFAEAYGLVLEQVDARRSLFGDWLFQSGAASRTAIAADIFLSRKFTEAFQYKLIDTRVNGDNQSFVTATRTSPNIAHLYSWALAPLQGRPPYELVDAVDTYLTKVNYPLEESRMEFTLIRESDSWYISAIRDEKFAQLQGQMTSPSSTVATAAPSASPTGGEAPAAASTKDAGRQTADAQFNATLNQLYQTSRPQPQTGADKAEKTSTLAKVKRFFSGSKDSKIVARLSGERLTQTFKNIRDAFVSYAQSHSTVPDSATVYDWSSLRQVVNAYSDTSLPATEEKAGFSFVRYQTSGLDDYVLLVKLQHPQNGLSQVEVTPYGIDRVN